MTPEQLQAIADRVEESERLARYASTEWEKEKRLTRMLTFTSIGLAVLLAAVASQKGR